MSVREEKKRIWKRILRHGYITGPFLTVNLRKDDPKISWFDCKSHNVFFDFNSLRTNLTSIIHYIKNAD